MSRVNKFLLLFLGLLIVIGIAMFYRSFLMVYFFEPIALVVWVFWRLLSSIDQSIYWVTMIVICIILIVRLMPFGHERSSNSKYDYTYEPLDRVGYWQKLLSEAPLGTVESNNLRENLKKILNSVLAQNERTNSNELSDRSLLDNELLSKEVRLFLDSSKENKRFSANIPGWLRKRMKISTYLEYALIDEILKLMEADLEISYDE